MMYQLSQALEFQKRKTHSTISGLSIANGFSLIELIVTLSITAILFGIAIPSFKDFIEKSKINSAAFQLRTTLSLARQTSISHGKDTYICELVEDKQCNTDRPFGANWSNGWLVFEDLNNNADLDKDDLIVNIHKNTSGIGVIFNQQGRLRFRPDGSARSAGFYVCTEKLAKHILLLYSGRSRSKVLTDEDRIKNCQKHITY